MKQPQETTNNRVGKTRNPFKKNWNISCKNRHDKGQRWQGSNRNRRGGNNAKSYRKKKKKGPNNPNNHDSMIVHLETDILEYKVK